LPAFSAATCAANGVLLREPRNPQPPAVAHDSALPWRSVMVTIVLLNEACTNTMPSAMFFRARLRGRLLAFAMAVFLIEERNYLRTARRGPLRVRALVRVCWPRVGSPRRWRRPR